MPAPRLSQDTGLTPMEVFIVVILVGIIAAVAVPRVSITKKDRVSEAQFDRSLGILRGAVMLYAIQHGGMFPGQVRHTDGQPVTSDREAAAAFEAQLTQYTDVNGKTSTVGTDVYRFGPYFRDGLPINPLPIKSRKVVADTTEKKSIFGTGEVGGEGWKVAVQIGQVIANNADFDKH